MHFVVLTVLISLAVAELAPLYKSETPVEGSYFVVFHDSVEAESLDMHFSAIAKKMDIEMKHQYKTVLKGFAADLNDEQVLALRSNPIVKYVEMDQIMSISDCPSNREVHSWGLTRICEQARPVLDGLYYEPRDEGKGVTVYIVDTGILDTHEDFLQNDGSSRAVFGWKAQSSWSNEDVNGHGTHVASTVGGNAYGVTSQTELVAVKVLGDDGSGTNTGVIGGIDWAVSHATKKSVINMSLGGGASSSLDNAINKAFENGVVVVVAAGNENQNACNVSPARATDAITVGSTNFTPQPVVDIRSYFSNYGPCVNVFAPGSDITAAFTGVPEGNAYRTLSGTSMASPHVAGVAALLWGEHGSASAVRDALYSATTKGIIDMKCSTSTCEQSPNQLLFNGCLN